ncbi:MAG: PQQ-binding-like beta-propeller repeat protein [Acidimicrobiales bacterium]
MPDDRRRRLTLLGLAVVSVLALAVSVFADGFGDDDPSSASGDGGSPSSTDGANGGDDDGGDPEEETDPAFFRTDFDGLADPDGYTKPYPNATVAGLLTFRGNPSRSYYGLGPVPTTTPAVLHQFPDEPMCRQSTDLGTTKTWCGMGWTGQPTIVERDDRTWAIFGGYDGHIHFMDVATGERILPDVETGDIIKGTPTIDPEGYPLVYSGSRDNLLRIVALDRPGVAEVLWTLDSESVQPVKWNDDWDSSPIVIGDYMIVGSESSRFWVIKLNRSYDAAGLVHVDPEITFTDEAWDEQVIADNEGDQHASVESSVTIVDNVAYFGTSAGLVLGYDLEGVDDGQTPERVFRFYTAGDNDPSIVADDEGMLYVAGEFDRPTTRAREVGQLTKLDPSKPDDPIVWTYNETEAVGQGIYGTPGVHGDTIIITSDGGRLAGLDRATGAVKWERQMAGPAWASPVIVDDVLLVGDCLEGNFHAYDVSDPDIAPPELWSLHLGGCIEATPAVWKGRIYIGTRGGYLYTLG